jgi:hypothetical protein
MEKSEWSDRQLEEMLRQMPKIEDYRDPRDIYQNLSIKIKRGKRKSWVLPSFATAAVLLLLFIILAPNLANWSQNSSEDSMKQKSTSSENKITAQLKSEKKDSSSKSAQKIGTPKLFMQSANFKNALYKNELGSRKFLTYWIPDQQGQILIPVSTLINHPGNKSWVDLFNEKTAQLKEKEWGLSDFYPLNAKMKLDTFDHSIIIDVPANHSYGEGSATETSFINAIEKNVSTNSNIKKVKFTTNGNPGIILGNYGEKKELDIHLEQNHANFFFIPDGKEIPFIVPSQKSYTDVAAALESMWSDQPEWGLKASLPPSLKFRVDAIKNKTLFLSVQDSSNLENIPMSVYSYEAILLTAKEFGLEHVMLENPPIKNLGPFDLLKENEVPVAPNLRTVEDQP